MATGPNRGEFDENRQESIPPEVEGQVVAPRVENAYDQEQHTDPQQHIIVNVPEHRGRPLIGRKTSAVLCGAAVVVAGAVLLSKCSGEDTGAAAKKAEVFKVVPTDLNCRAIMQATVETDAWNRPTSPVDHLPGLGAIAGAVEHSYSTTAFFVGPNGKGGGEIDTLVCFKANGVTVTTLPNGMQQENIPNSAVAIASFVNEGQSEVTLDHGDLASLKQTGNTILEDAPGSRDIVTSEQKGDARIGRIARMVAVNVVATRCLPQAWGVVEQAVSLSEQQIAKAQYNNQVAQAQAKGATVEPFKGLKVNFDSSAPTPKTPYPNLGTNTKVVEGGNCTVEPGAFQPDATATGVPIMDANHIPVPNATWNVVSKLSEVSLP